MILAVLGLAAVGFGGCYVTRAMPQLASAESWANAKYHKGGFEPKISKKEAALILEVSPSARRAPRRSEMLTRKSWFRTTLTAVHTLQQRLTKPRTSSINRNRVYCSL